MEIFRIGSISSPSSFVICKPGLEVSPFTVTTSQELDAKSINSSFDPGRGD
jgi:hypothetical protein